MAKTGRCPKLSGSITDFQSRRICMRKGHLISVSAFYKNNEPSGVGFLQTTEDADLDKVVDRFVKSYEEAWATAGEAERSDLISHYFDQLVEFGTMKNDLTQSDCWMGIMNIWFLEKHGFLKPDEFNGCQFSYDA
jgi:hypothetical protein